VLRTDPLPCTPADSAVRQIIVRIRGTSASVHGSLDPSDLRRTVFCVGSERCQLARILGHNSRDRDPDIQPGSSMADRMLDRRLSFQNQLQVVVVFRAYRLPPDAAVLCTGFQSFPVKIRPDLRLDHLPTPVKPAVFEPHAGSIFLTFHAFEFIVFPGYKRTAAGCKLHIPNQGRTPQYFRISESVLPGRRHGIYFG